MTRCTPAPACVQVRVQATMLWPHRSQASDGICASAQHTTANPGSDHEPHIVVNGVAYATAVDLTDDKVNGCDADRWAEWLVLTRDPRVKYVICNRRMVSSYPTSRYPAWTWRPYDGTNPHDKHTHLSIKPEAIFDRAPWFPEGDDDMPSIEEIRAVVREEIQQLQGGPDVMGRRLTLRSMLEFVQGEPVFGRRFDLNSVVQWLTNAAKPSGSDVEQ